MAVWDEQPPGQATPGATPNGITLAALAAKLFGRQSPVPDGGAPQQTTAAITPLANLPGAPGAQPPGPTMPAGVGGVPANLPQPGAPGPNTRPLPSPNPMLGGNFAFPNKQARNGAVVATGIENVSEAIHNFKVKKDQDEYQKAKSSWDLYQKAAAVDPQTGQPVDPHTMAILGSDPKIVKSWEKMLKMEFPHEQGPPDPKTGKPTQGAAILPQPTADPAAQLKQLMAQRALTQARNAPGETGDLTPAESHKAALIAAGITPKAQDQKALDKIDAEIENYKSEVKEHNAQAAKLQADMARIPVQNALDRQRMQTEIARQNELAAEAQKDLQEAGKSKSLQLYTTGRGSLQTEFQNQSRILTRMQNQSMAARSRLGKVFGETPDVTPEMQAQQDRVTQINDALTTYMGMQDDVMSGRVTPTEAFTKSRRAASLDNELNPWNGVPQDAPQTPPKEMPEGYMMYSPDGTPLAAKQGNKWVAP